MLLALALAGCGARLVAPTVPSMVTSAGVSPGGAIRESILYNFRGRPDGWNPFAGLIMDGSGALYGTTVIGGSCNSFYYGCGTVFKLTPSGSRYSETVLYRFAGIPDGEAPNAPLALGAHGRLYGTTYAGGNAYGMGTVFELTPSGLGYAETVIHRFAGLAKGDGATPYGGVAVDENGNIYGTTFMGGVNDAGIIYKLTPSRGSYRETVLHSFGGGSDEGGLPESTVTLDENGAIYGTADDVVFKVSRSGSGYTESTIYHLRGLKNGSNATGTLLVGKGGVLYGTAQNGGPFRCGTVFRLAPKGTGYTFRLLHAFDCYRDFQDGGFPQAGVIADAKGSLYGTTVNGGNLGCGLGGCGIVFKLTPSGRRYIETVLYSFHPKYDGNEPFGGVIAGPDGRLYGTTGFGGQSSATIFGTVFELSDQH